MKKQFIVRSNIQALCFMLSIALSSLPAFAALTPTGKQLFQAIKKNKPQDVERLLSEETLVDVRDSSNNTPLHCAALEGHVEIVQLLLNKRASVETCGHFNQTPLHLAAWHGHVKVLQLLLDNHAHIEARNLWGRTPLHSAVYGNRKKATRILLNKKANIEARDGDNYTPLHTAIIHNNDIITDLLLQSGADKEAVTGKGENLLELAVENSSGQSVQALLSAGLKGDAITLTLALKNSFKRHGKAIIHMLLLQNRTLLASQAVHELLTAHSFDLPAFKKNKERIDKHLEKVAMLLEAHCSLPLVLAQLIGEYHNDFDLRINFFTQTKFSPQETSHTTSEHSSGEEDDDWHYEEVSSP